MSYMKQPNKKCLECGKLFYKPPCLERIKCCSDKCSRQQRKGKTYEELVGKERATKWKQKVSIGTKNNLPSTVIKKGQRLSPSTEFKEGECVGEKHHNWKGDSAGYGALHEWIKRHKLKPKFCPICNINKKLHAHNISGEYKRDVDDWVYLCQGCHFKLHRKIRNKQIRKKCDWCDKYFITYKKEQRFCSVSCGLRNTHKKRRWLQQGQVPEQTQ